MNEVGVGGRQAVGAVLLRDANEQPEGVQKATVLDHAVDDGFGDVMVDQHEMVGQGAGQRLGRLLGTRSTAARCRIRARHVAPLSGAASEGLPAA